MLSLGKYMAKRRVWFESNGRNAAARPSRGSMEFRDLFRGLAAFITYVLRIGSTRGCCVNVDANSWRLVSKGKLSREPEGQKIP